MRYLSVLLVVLLLAACADAAPSDTTNNTPPPGSNDIPVPTTEAGTTADGSTADGEATEDPISAARVNIQPPGTIVAPATEDPDPNAGQPFDIIQYEQTGGINDITLTVEVRSDGTVIRDGETLTVAPAEINALNALLEEIDFYNIQGQFTVAGSSQEIYYYRVTVSRGGSDIMIRAQDGYTPDDLLRLFSALSLIGTGQPGSPPG